MKIIQALKTIKSNVEKVKDLSDKIKLNSARLSSQTSPYGDRERAQVDSWRDTVLSTLAENEKLTNRIHRTNVTTKVEVDVVGDGSKIVTKTIDEWISRRKNGIDLEIQMYRSMTDRNLQETLTPAADGTKIHITVHRNYDSVLRDERLASLTKEKSIIDGHLEIVNAITDLVE